ncbi:MAG: helix-turn-helix domain-containing protein [Janthinobacterium lividum]
MPRTAQQQLRYTAEHPGAQQRHAFRARLVLAVTAGASIRHGGAVHCTTRRTVSKWVRRVQGGGVDALADAPRSGRPVLYPQDYISSMCEESGGCARPTDDRPWDERSNPIPLMIGLVPQAGEELPKARRCR